jgi:hypothetical protein
VSAAATTVALPPRTARKDVRAMRLLTLFVIVTGAVVLYRNDADHRALLAPIVVVAIVAVFYVAVLVSRDGKLPVFEAATLFVAATAAYTIIPLVQFLMGGMMAGPWGDPRLYVWEPTPQEFGGFAWRHVVLLCSFVFPYLLVRGRRLYPLRDVYVPGRELFVSLVLWIAIVSLFFFTLEWYIGPQVSVYEGGTGAESRQLPHFVLQFANVLSIVRFTMKQCLVVMLVARWQRRLWRFVLFGWLAFEVVHVVVRMQGRTPAVLLLLTAIVSYHRLVKPLRVGRAAVIAAVVLIAILGYGAMRDIHEVGVDRRSVWGSPTEFQILYGTAYDIHMKKKMGELPPVPPQLYFFDFYRIIPSQLLPFYKWDPSDWYLGVIGLSDSGVGLMFGFIAQAELGRGFIEVAIRGMLLGLFYAFAHRTYHRYSISFWGTIAYLFLLSWSYFAFRSTSFDILYRFVYYFVPTVLLVSLLTLLISPLIRATRSA